MLVRIRARPHTLYLSHGRTVLATGDDGFVEPVAEQGLFVDETRLLSRYRYLIDGQEPEPNLLSNVEQHSFFGYYTILAPGVDAGPRDAGSGQVPLASRQPLELRVSRFAGEGLHEDIDITNYSREPTRFTFTIELDADFADIAGPVDVKVQRRIEENALIFDAPALGRSVRITISHNARFEHDGTGRSACPPRLIAEISLEPHESWHLCLDFSPTGQKPCHHCHSFAIQDERTLMVLQRSAKFETRESETLAHVVHGALEQARYDLAALRLFDLDDGPDAWTMAAGLPLYIALFGRDTLTASWQAALLGDGMMRGTLRALANCQGTTTDDWRDEQPGRMLHEAHTGPMSLLNLNPRGRSYGSITTSGLYAFIVAELWHWTGDPALVRPFLEPALRALAWLDRERKHEGVYTYQTRSHAPDAVKHQAWKDSPDAIVDACGRAVEPPIATCEEQGFVFIAKLHLAETLWSLGDRDEARRLFAEAMALKDRFSEAFWMEEEGFYALALDSNFEPVRSIASNAGHCVATAIARDEHVPHVVNRLFAPDLFSGWGIRTLSSDNPAYNPYSYHLGSIWPVEHGTFALGLMRYGLHDRVEQLARTMFEAAALFDFYRLPELFGGQPRDDAHPFPSMYPNANSPQAWSASMVFCLLQAMLGLYPYAPMRALLVDPHLPPWLPEITLRDLRVGEATVTIRFRGKRFRVMEKKGTLHVIRQPMPWSLTATTGERLRDLLESLLKGAVRHGK